MRLPLRRSRHASCSRSDVTECLIGLDEWQFNAEVLRRQRRFRRESLIPATTPQKWGTSAQPLHVIRRRLQTGVLASSGADSIGSRPDPTRNPSRVCMHGSMGRRPILSGPKRQYPRLDIARQTHHQLPPVAVATRIISFATHGSFRKGIPTTSRSLTRPAASVDPITTAI